MRISARGSPTNLKLALGPMAPTSEQADLLDLLTRSLPLLEAGTYDMEVNVEQSDEKGSGLKKWSASFSPTEIASEPSA